MRAGSLGDADGGKQWARSKGVSNPSNNLLEHFDTPFPPYPAWGSTSLNRDAATLVEYRRPGQRGSAHRAYVPGELWCEFTARADLEAITGPVASLKIVGTIKRDRPDELRPVSVPEAQAEPPHRRGRGRGDPAPLTIPLVVLPPRAHVLHIDEAWAIGPDRLERWNLHSGHQILMPVELGRDAAAGGERRRGTHELRPNQSIRLI